MSPTFVLVSFFFWTWLLGAPGALLAVFLSALLIVVLDSYERTRWLAAAMTGGDMDAVETVPAGTATFDEPARI
jgi:predicted PurR-regulated permease PerM